MKETAYVVDLHTSLGMWSAVVHSSTAESAVIRAMRLQREQAQRQHDLAAPEIEWDASMSWLKAEVRELNVLR